MYHNIAVKMTSFFMKRYNNNSEPEVVIYGAELLISSIFEIIIILFMGIVMREWWETICFLLAFCPLRMMAGGYHAPNYTLCTIEFSLFYIILCAYFPNFEKTLGVLLELLSSLIIWMLAPVEDANKPIKGVRRKRLRVKSRCVVIIEFFIYLIVIFGINREDFGKFVCASTMTIALLIILGTIKNSFIKK